MSFPVALRQVSIQTNYISLFVPDAQTVKEAYEKGEIEFPYWSQVWPAAEALSAFLLLNPAYIEAKNVLELGAGLGLPSLVAARYAKSVLCTDVVPEAVAIAQQSAQHHCLQNFYTAVINWHHLPENLEADVVLLSDINYEPVAFSSLLKMVAIFLQKGATLLLSTPQRLMAKDFIVPLVVNCRKQEEFLLVNDGKEVAITVMVLGKR